MSWRRFLEFAGITQLARSHRLPLLGLDDAEAERAGSKPLDDPGGYAAHGDWPFVPSDLKVSRHSTRLTKGEQQDHA